MNHQSFTCQKIYDWTYPQKYSGCYNVEPMMHSSAISLSLQIRPCQTRALRTPKDIEANGFFVCLVVTSFV